MIFVKNSGRNCVVAPDTPVRCLIEFQRILRCFQIKHKQSAMMFVQVKVGLVLRVYFGSGVRIRWRHWEEVHRFSALVIFHILLAHVLQILLKFRILKTQRGTAMMRILSLSFCTKTLKNPDSRLSDLPELWCTSVLLFENWYLMLWLLTCHLWSFFPANFLSFCVWLVSPLRESDTVSVLRSCPGCLFEQTRCILFIVLLLFCHVFQGASSTGLSCWINLTATFLEDLLIMEQVTNFFLELADAHTQGVPWLSMCHSLLQVSLNLRTSHCLDFLSVWQCWLLQSGDYFELLLCAHVPKSISQVCFWLALSHQCRRFLLCCKYVFLSWARFCFRD